MQGVVATARDGREIPCYLTLPKDLPPKNLPMIVMPHGGPWYRDHWGYTPDIQWLANRGYAVLQPQFRGSTGFGLAWLNGGDLQFGPGRVLGDILDATSWAVAQGIADSTRLGIMGGSFGGYATLCALAFAPGRFRCGVDLVGPSDLGHLISTFPPYWEARRRRWLNRMGDVIADSALNRRVSPLYHADAITAPLLVGHGANDPRARLEASERIVAALRERGREVTFVVYPDEGHGFVRPENNQDFYARTEEFLAKHLGGRAIPRADVPGSSAELR
jgi:dipeptidyl aminopeptidase/acylaminoacyl peptidase